LETFIFLPFVKIFSGTAQSSPAAAAKSGLHPCWPSRKEHATHGSHRLKAMAAVLESPAAR